MYILQTKSIVFQYYKFLDALLDAKLKYKKLKWLVGRNFILTNISGEFANMYNKKLHIHTLNVKVMQLLFNIDIINGNR